MGKCLVVDGGGGEGGSIGVEGTGIVCRKNVEPGGRYARWVELRPFQTVFKSTGPAAEACSMRV